MKSLLLLALLAAQTPADVVVADPVSVVVDGGVVEAAPPGPTVVVDEGVIVKRAELQPGDTVIIGDAFKDVVGIISNWRAATALSLAAAIIALLMRLSKLGALYTFLEVRGWSWARPWLAALLGGLGAVVTVLTAGVRDVGGLVSAFISGVLAGFTAGGGYDAGRLVSPVERSKKRVTTETIEAGNKALADKVVLNAKLADEETAPVRAAVNAAKNLPTHKAAEALAALLRSPPKAAK